MEEVLLQDTGETASIIIVGIFLLFFMCMLLLFFFYFSKKKVIQKELEKKTLELHHQKELMIAGIEVQEAERKRIAQDLHDDISSKLNVVSLNSHLLSTPDLTDDEVEEITGNIITMVGKALENSRRIAHDLLPPVLEKFGLDAGLEEVCNEYNSSKAVHINYEGNNCFEGDFQHRHLHVFRIVQELINNSVKHGKATEISLKFTKKADGKTVCNYTDNGKGFVIGELKEKAGLGMKNIESRVIFLGGELDIQSQVNKGVTVVFNF